MSHHPLVFSQDTRDPIRLRLNQDLTGLTVDIRTKNLRTGVVVTGEATVIGGDETYGDVERAWTDEEREADRKDLYAIEAVVKWPGDPVLERTHPRDQPLLVRVEPRRTYAPVPDPEP